MPPSSWADRCLFRLGPVESRLGSLVREAALLWYELHRASLGLDEDTIRELRELDRVILPETDVGLVVPFDVVWAEKRRAKQEDRDESGK